MPLKIPANLSFAKSIYPTDAMFSQSLYADPSVERPILIEERKNNGVMASMKAEKDQKPASDIMHNNPTLNQRAFIDPDMDTLVVRFGVDFFGRTKAPHACNDTKFISLVNDFHEAYATIGGFQELAERYVRNLAAGTWLWRNMDLSHAACVTFTIEAETKIEVTVDCFDVPNRMNKPLPADLAAALKPVIDQVAVSLAEGILAKVDVIGRVKLGGSREVYPSQVFPVKMKGGEDEKRGAADVTRMLQSKVIKGERHPFITSEKIGAALRTIDTWHNGFSDPETGVELVSSEEALTVNPYGQNRDINMPLRYGKTAQSLRSCLQGLDKLLIDLVEKPDGVAVRNAAHFIIANLIRGGVMGEKDA